MKLLVTGGTGFIGSHTAAALLDAGHALRLLVRDAGKAKRVFEALGQPVPECVVGDVTDAASVAEALGGCDGVMHAAALVALDAARAKAVGRTNVQGTQNVIGEARRLGLTHVVYVSSASALFDPGGGVIGPDTDPAHLDGSVYSASKARTERWIREQQDEGVPVSATYPCGVLGPQVPTLTEVHRALPLQLRLSTLTDTGVNVVDVRDLARVHVALLERPGDAGRWIVGGSFLSWEAFADLLAEITGRRIPRVRVPGAVLRGLGSMGDALKRVVSFDLPLSWEAMATATCWPGMDSRRTEQELGVSFRDPRETVSDTVRWMVEEGHLPARLGGRLSEGPSPS